MTNVLVRGFGRRSGGPITRTTTVLIEPVDITLKQPALVGTVVPETILFGEIIVKKPTDVEAIIEDDPNNGEL